MASIGMHLVDLASRSPRSEAIQRLAQGNTKPWSKVLGCFLIFMNTYGIASTYGAYQSFYQTSYLTLHSPSAISWIGTVQVFLLGLVGVIAGPFFDSGYTRSVLSLGCSLIVFGYLMLSLSHTYAQILLSQGFCIGIGSFFFTTWLLQRLISRQAKV